MFNQIGVKNSYWPEESEFCPRWVELCFWSGSVLDPVSIGSVDRIRIQSNENGQEKRKTSSNVILRFFPIFFIETLVVYGAGWRKNAVASGRKDDTVFNSC